MSKEKVNFQIVSNEGAVVLQFKPVWARMEVIMALTGLSHHAVRRLYNNHRVRAVKSEPDKPNSTVVFNVNDVLDWMDGPEAKGPPPYKLPEA